MELVSITLFVLLNIPDLLNSVSLENARNALLTVTALEVSFATLLTTNVLSVSMMMTAPEELLFVPNLLSLVSSVMTLQGAGLENNARQILLVFNA